MQRAQVAKMSKQLQDYDVKLGKMYLEISNHLEGYKLEMSEKLKETIANQQRLEVTVAEQNEVINRLRKEMTSIIGFICVSNIQIKGAMAFIKWIIAFW